MLSYQKIFRKPYCFFISVATLLLLALALAACGADSVDADAAEPMQIRTPHPTFTPTPVQPVSAAAPATEAPSEAADPTVAGESAADPTQNPQPVSENGEQARLIINIDLVNLRDAPSIESTVITILERGQEFDILGRDASGEWWFVCCFEEQAGWVTGEFADFVGPADQAPIVGADARAPTSTPQADNATSSQLAQGGPVTTQDSATDFELVAQEQFPEADVVRVYAYIFDDRGALAGYSIQVSKDGTLLPVSELSFGPNSAFTWPVADPRQRAQNLKVEFPGIEAAGVWQVQVVQGENIAGPVATFTLSEDETNRELYVRYKRR